MAEFLDLSQPQDARPTRESQATGPGFRPFDPEGELRVYVRNLPHWRQAGATYFVTFRQDDSIPAGIFAEWVDLRTRWYRAHGLEPAWQQTNPELFDSTYRAIPAGVRRIFEREQARVLHEQLDRGHGSCVFRHAEPRKFLADSLAFFHGQRLWMGDFVVMPNHTHALIRPFEGWELEDLLGSIKKWVSRHISEWLAERPASQESKESTHNKPRFWQHESYDRIVRDADELTAFRRYIARNPDSAKLRPGEYTYHAADWLDPFAPRVA